VGWKQEYNDIERKRKSKSMTSSQIRRQKGRLLEISQISSILARGSGRVLRIKHLRKLPMEKEEAKALDSTCMEGFFAKGE
jgi:hypothetical protein